ncbi:MULTISPECIES: DNA repair protein RadA [Nosocomiicoccus]|uniref:DNA repair protein RadA n=2 Tax=Nosocomiicoccus TaxID=489909 RepID=A0AAF0YJ15_9STAP|nr:MULTISPECIES: DNA repair protein RadA [Nosocomiicoccus]OFL49402.1 DNA repair protein RadA [Nosocomiicoccus sp. HMSC067E10]OFS61528.1 DNA repair protein RadA [Nosocomiicoccus sp. HMSC09A07]WOS95560.1 DNA repair protein RadA [Nosocomiicoccus massiliensis]
MAKTKTVFECLACGFESPKWYGRCPNCGAWNQMEESLVHKETKASGRGTLGKVTDEKTRATQLSRVTKKESPRTKTKSGEFDRVLGGGIVDGSLILIGGDPGIGKSTILLQTALTLAEDYDVLYVSGEESLEQIKMRADRITTDASNLNVYAETNLFYIHDEINKLNPDFLIIDSIQTVFHPDITSAPGSVSQVRECTQSIMNIAKGQNIATFIVGHVTKDGQIAGPRLLEHMVDTVLYFEGDQHHTFRILRAVKNRFGSTNEMGIFEMKYDGLKEVLNPSEIFLEERSKNTPGSAIVATMEGTRAMLVEIQALVTPTHFHNPRRMATGIDHNRLSLLMAVLEKSEGLLMQQHDAYIKVAGGVKLDEPAVDLAVIMAIASSFKNISVRGDTCFIGEVGLTGEIRRVTKIEQRLQEAAKLGFNRAIIPASNLAGLAPVDIEVVGARTLKDAMKEIYK